MRRSTPRVGTDIWPLLRVAPQEYMKKRSAGVFGVHHTKLLAQARPPWCPGVLDAFSVRARTLHCTVEAGSDAIFCHSPRDIPPYFSECRSQTVRIRRIMANTNAAQQNKTPSAPTRGMNDAVLGSLAGAASAGAAAAAGAGAATGTT